MEENNHPPNKIIKRSNRPVIRLAFVITLSGLLSACLDDEPTQYFNRVIFQNQQQCSTYLTNVECSKFFEKIRQDLEQNRLAKFRTYDKQEDCRSANTSCDLRTYQDDPYKQPRVVWIANPRYYVAELDRDYNETNNYREDMHAVDYNLLYNDPQSSSNPATATPNTSSSNTANILGFYYFGMMNNGYYQNGSSYSNYYRQPVVPRSGSYAASNGGRSYSGSYSAVRSTVSRGGFTSGSSSSSS